LRLGCVAGSCLERPRHFARRRKASAAVLVAGLAVSLVPIVLRVLPPLARDAATNGRDPNYLVTVVGLLLYIAVVARSLLLLDVE